MIVIKKYSELKSNIRGEINSRTEDEFGHISIVNETEWAIPDWTIIKYQNEEIATFYNLIERVIVIDDEEFKAAGINNVITTTKYRGRGLATNMLKETEDFIFEELKAELALLLCADELVPFYQRLNWYKIDCPVYFEQPYGKERWRANTMLLTEERQFKANKIELNGLPW